MRKKQTLIYKIINLQIALILFIAFSIISCNQTQKNNYEKKSLSIKKILTGKKVPNIKPKFLSEINYKNLQDSISLFYVWVIEEKKGDTIGFVSVSDVDKFPGNQDSPIDSVDRLVIPNLENRKSKDTRFLTLKAKYRKRLLKGTGISETDTMFLYNYKNNIILKFSISSLNTVANLDYYKDDTRAMHSASDYNFGFKIPYDSIPTLSKHSETFVFIGATNPFITGEMRPVIWKKINKKKVPAIPLETKLDTLLKSYKFVNSYYFESDGFRYYLQEYLKNFPPSTSFRMLTLNKNNNVIINNLDYETESSIPATISIVNNRQNTFEQWTGHLLKNRPPVLIGFDQTEFGCPIIPFVDKSNKYIETNCDNRH